MEYGLLLLLRFQKVGGIMSETTVKWHPYPEEKPPKEGLYLITLKFGNTKDVSLGYLTKGIYSNTLTAWAELPKPYEDEI